MGRPFLDAARSMPLPLAHSLKQTVLVVPSVNVATETGDSALSVLATAWPTMSWC